MAKRPKHPKLPNGFGSIKYLGKGRTNPYAVHPPTTEFAPNGSPVTPKALCYVDDWYKGFYALIEFNNGSFTGKTLQEIKVSDADTDFNIASKIIAAYNNMSRTAQGTKTFAEVYAEFYDFKYNREKTRVYSSSTISSTKTAFKNCAALHDKTFKELKTQDLQKVVDDCPLKHASKELIVNLFRQMYAFADMQDITDKNYSIHVKINTPDDDEKGIPFSADEIDVLWKNSGDEIINSILIMIYSGFRIGAYGKMSINMDDRYFKGGVKTAASKGRIVPIHSMIYNIVTPDLPLFNLNARQFRTIFNGKLTSLGITDHTPHDCRHTFSWLCDKYNVDALSKRMMLGHSLGNDVTDAKYGHRTLAELTTEIEKIKHW